MEIKRLSFIEHWRTMRELKRRNKAINETIRAVSEFVDKLPPLSSLVRTAPGRLKIFLEKVLTNQNPYVIMLVQRMKGMKQNENFC